MVTVCNYLKSYHVEEAERLFPLIFIYLAAPALVASCELLLLAHRILFPDQGLNPRPPALGAWSVSH